MKNAALKEGRFASAPVVTAAVDRRSLEPIATLLTVKS
jgi:hypothetical protein